MNHTVPQVHARPGELGEQLCGDAGLQEVLHLDWVDKILKIVDSGVLPTCKVKMRSYIEAGTELHKHGTDGED